MLHYSGGVDWFKGIKGQVIYAAAPAYFAKQCGLKRRVSMPLLMGMSS